MRRLVLLTYLTIAGFFMLSAETARAQSAVVLHIDQDFVAAGKKFPAGTYRVYQGSPLTGQMLLLRGEMDSAFLIPATSDGTFVGQPSVTLRREGDTYYLSQIATDEGVYFFPMRSTLKHMAKATRKTQSLHPEAN